MCREDVPLFLGQFFRATIFLSLRFKSTDAFFGSILPIFAYFFGVYYYAYFIKNSNCF